MCMPTRSIPHCFPFTGLHFWSYGGLDWVLKRGPLTTNGEGFLQVCRPSCHPTNSVKSLTEFKALTPTRENHPLAHSFLESHPLYWLSDAINQAKICLQKQSAIQCFSNRSNSHTHYCHCPQWHLQHVSAHVKKSHTSSINTEIRILTKQHEDNCF